MAQWRVRDPGSFPPGFHEAMRAGVGVDKLVSRRFTLPAARSDQTQWQIFRFSLRNYPMHPSAAWESKLVHRTRIAWNESMRMWDLLLTSRESVFTDIEKMS
jgi:hypothetical protein